MLPTKLLAFLRCPEDHSDLKAADDTLIQQINSAIRAGLITNHAGQVLETAIDGGLIRARGDLLYPVVRDIPLLLRDEAISLDQLATPSNNK
jgi:uncharacterized protein YbaR (Trm112 family)